MFKHTVRSFFSCNARISNTFKTVRALQLYPVMYYIHGGPFLSLTLNFYEFIKHPNKGH
jgi:hypothetical protein